MVRMRTASVLPFASKAISARVTWSRPCGSHWKVSVRPLIHFTGRPSRFAAHSTMPDSGKILPRRPKPPPTSGEMTRSFSFGTFRISRASPSCTRITPWVGECSV